MELKNMKILLIGGSGMLGQTFKESFDKIGISYLNPTSKELDITDRSKIDQFFKDNEFDTVINCAAYTKVDLAEDQKEDCYRLNTLAAQILAEESANKGVKLVHFSTDYVYSGDSQRPYKEEEAGNCVNYYGQSKFEGENEIIKSCDDYLIFRISWLYHKVYGKNFYKTMVALGSQKSELNVVADQIGCPTSCDEVVEVVLEALEKNLKGIYNFSGDKEMSWADFAADIMKENGLECKINYITTEQYPTRAKRPKYSVMDKSMLQSNLD
jgi:dTDP-4-dehydrorhamnose reductase